MEGGWEYKTLIDELKQGKEQAQQLRFHLSSSPISQSQDLLQQIMASYENALQILKPSGSLRESSLSADGSPRSDDMNKGIEDQKNNRNVSKKRKSVSTWTENVRVSLENGLEGHGEDGYSWRKYGQKDILGATYPRSYYRCTYRHMQNCWATKQVQRSDDDPSVFEITYKGTHVCNLASNSVPPPTSPEKQELKRCNHRDDPHQSLQSNQMLTNLQANLRVETENLENKEKAFPFSFPPTFTTMTGENHAYPLAMVVDDGLSGAYTPSFISPANSESNYFSISPYHMNRFGEPGDMFSANTSSANSPIMGMEFSSDHASLDQDFPFDTPGFFT